MAKKDLPHSIGNIYLTIFDESQADKLRAAMSKHVVQKEFKLENLEKDISSVYSNNVYGVVSVEAKDYESANIRAKRQLQRMLDLLNFFSEFVSFSTNAWAYIPSENHKYSLPTYVLNDDDYSFNNSHETRGPVNDLSISRIFEEDKERNIGFDFILNILNKDKTPKTDRQTRLLKAEKSVKKAREKFEESLITAIQWAGRAVTSERREESFLFYTIALESILLEEGAVSETSYRLASRIAILCNNRKLDFVNKIKKLYSLRSKIVHNGKYEISQLDVNFMYNLTLVSLSILCKEELFQEMKSKEHLWSHLDNQLFSGDQ